MRNQIIVIDQLAVKLAYFALPRYIIFQYPDADRKNS